MSIISVDVLAGRLGDPTLCVVDTRWYLGKPGAGRDAYVAGHIPGAIHLDLDTDLSDPNGLGAPGRHPLPSPAAFRERMMRAGIGTDSFVVAYDDQGGTVAARLWWMLDNLGHRAVAVLDGGLPAWTAAGLPLSAAEPTVTAADELSLAGSWSGVIERSVLRDRLSDVVLLDGRAEERYRGEVEPIDPAAGHIPTAVSAPVTGNLGEGSTFRSVAELRSRLGGLTSAGRPAVAYCGSGTNACHNILAARLAGLDDPLLYVGSFSDWSRSGMPVATGPEPGDA